MDAIQRAALIGIGSFLAGLIAGLVLVKQLDLMRHLPAEAELAQCTEQRRALTERNKVLVEEAAACTQNLKIQENFNTISQDLWETKIRELDLVLEKLGLPPGGKAHQ